MSQLTIDGVEPVQVTDDFIISKVVECLDGKKCHAFGEPKAEWIKAFHASYREGELESWLLTYSQRIVRESRQSVIEYARELIDMAYSHGWTDQLEEWGVWQKEVI
ncbi:hypothetical protein JHL22_05140 [Advenella sp. WQ 585]|uniref:Uncharacterized protein n=1 Tax=Advenella mandrilli TaxID=2800330 RepID=A0ABS1EEF8_9BURK|nr:hypothetical protein [Advenella mandrilli]MBK1780596.1 hypothetical protein [Advenella mandrilli]